MAAPATLIERIRVTEGRYFLVKRLLDIALAAMLFALLIPIMALVAAMIALDSPGPVLFRQRRIGQDGLAFDMYKFRSMRHNSDASAHRLAVKRFMQGERLNHSRTTDAPYKLGDDPRITRVGKFIRKTSLDELPQLWNILTGEMSLVGPRPPVPYEVEMYSQRAMLRLDGKPGLTGPWQVYGRGTVTFEQMIEMDIAYLDNRSIWYDLKLIALTAPVALWGRGGA
jgi:lipopolysaccharide/colanic/teichoic acid biosynthesis glycosyltransferase